MNSDSKPLMTPTPSGTGLAAAAAYLFPFGRRTGSLDPAEFSRAAPWIVPLGLAVSLSWVIVFRAVWRLFGDTAGLRLVPSTAILLLDVAFTGSLLFMGLVAIVNGMTARQPLHPDAHQVQSLSYPAVTALVLAVLLQWALILSIPVEPPWWPSTGWRRHFNFMYPAPHYRPLILAPLWGRWGLLLAACVGRTARNADPQTVALCESMRPALLLRRAILPLALSVIYFSREGAYLGGVIAGLITFGITYLAAVFLAHRGGGQTRHSLYAVALVAQIAFLAVHRAFWPLIHR